MAVTEFTTYSRKRGLKFSETNDATPSRFTSAFSMSSRNTRQEASFRPVLMKREPSPVRRSSMPVAE